MGGKRANPLPEDHAPVTTAEANVNAHVLNVKCA